MLLDVLKRQLYLSQCDSEMEQLITDLSEEGKSFLNAYCSDLDFESGTQERALLVEYVRYALSNARDDFRKNYRLELFALSNRGRLKNASQTGPEE